MASPGLPGPLARAARREAPVPGIATEACARRPRRTDAIVQVQQRVDGARARPSIEEDRAKRSKHRRSLAESAQEA